MPLKGLQRAHERYTYQDLLTAYLLIFSLLGDRPRVSVDKKNSKGDRFDDVGVRSAARDTRRQLQHTTTTARVLCLRDFTGSQSRLRIDELIASNLADNPPADEYRVCANWLGIDDDVASLLRLTSANPTGPWKRAVRLSGRSETPP